MDDILTATFLGLSFGNLWLCALLVFSLQTTNRITCAGYLVGRAVAILALSLVVAGLGRFVTFDKGALNVASGGLLVLFSAYLVATRVFGWIPPWKKKRGAHGDGSGTHSGCSGECHSCPSRHDPVVAEACGDCDHDSLCDAEEPEVEALTRQARLSWGREVPTKRLAGFSMGMTLGALRGVAFCGKLAVLVPLLMGATILQATSISLSFTVASSIYPLLGFVLGSFALKLVKYKKHLFAVSSAMLAISGVYYMIK